MIKQVQCCPEYFGGWKGDRATPEIFGLSRAIGGRESEIMNDSRAIDGAWGLLLAKTTNDEIGKNLLWNVFAGKGGIETTICESTAVMSKVESRDRCVRGSFVVPKDKPSLLFVSASFVSWVVLAWKEVFGCFFLGCCWESYVGVRGWYLRWSCSSQERRCRAFG